MHNQDLDDVHCLKCDNVWTEYVYLKVCPHCGNQDTIMVELQHGHNEYVHDRITARDIGENFTLDQLAEIIEETREAFDNAIANMKEGQTHE